VTVPIEVAKSAATVTVDGPDVIKHKKGLAELDVTVASDGATPTGTVEAVVGSRVLDAADLADGSATLVVGPFTKGTVDVEVRYSGDAATEAASATTTIQVTASGKPGRG